MKKLALTAAIVLGLSLTTFAAPNDGGGLFQRGAVQPTSFYDNREGGVTTPNLPSHGETGNQNAPLSSGTVVLIGLGAAYIMTHRRKDE